MSIFTWSKKKVLPVSFFLRCDIVGVLHLLNIKYYGWFSDKIHLRGSYNKNVTIIVTFVILKIIVIQGKIKGN